MRCTGTNELHLSMGTRVVLRKNLYVNRGLVNGSMGTVRNMAWQDRMQPLVILMEFDNYEGPFFPGRKTLPLLGNLV